MRAETIIAGRLVRGLGKAAEFTRLDWVRSQLVPERAVYIGDTPIDIQASRAAGVRAVGVLTGACDSAMLSAHEPDRLVFSHASLLQVVEAG